ncbi:MAG: hypothetical protein F4X31_04090 [Gammaproteobacteria bacterium]|nr:hypothetical protein [Gammaproteobacteria bacterium]MYF12680.1 hypothetical protein [Gammaproteobacteria bacterium]
MMILEKPSVAARLLFGLLSAFTVTFSPAALASGSVGAGAGGISQYGALYKQGKSAFFRKLACNHAQCAFKRSEVSAGLARALVDSLATRAEVKFTESETDTLIRRLCPGEDSADCTGKVDEQEAVQYYLSRRFEIRL